MISNQVSSRGHAGLRDGYNELVRLGKLTSFHSVTPVATARARGHEASLNELMRAGEESRPDVVLVTTPHAFHHELPWVRGLLERCGDPRVLYWEGDPWHRWAKPMNRSMRAWLTASDIVFTHAREPHFSMFRRAGAADIRFRPETYCHVQFRDAERTDPLADTPPLYHVAVIGSRLAHWGGLSRIPGAASRLRLVRSLQRLPEMRLALYGRGWSGRGAMGELPYTRQPQAIRECLVSANWDHFPGHENYISDRLPISMIAGRVHVTTAHPRSHWMPGEDIGVFTERSIPALRNRIRELVASPTEEVLRLGRAAHEWASGRLSDRESTRFMLGAIDRSFLAGLPDDPCSISRATGRDDPKAEAGVEITLAAPKGEDPS